MRTHAHVRAALLRIQRAWRASLSRRHALVVKRLLEGVQCSVCYSPCVPLLCTNEHPVCRACWASMAPPLSQPPPTTKPCPLCRSTAGHYLATDLVRAAARVAPTFSCAECRARVPLLDADRHRHHTCPNRSCDCPMQCSLSSFLGGTGFGKQTVASVCEHLSSHHKAFRAHGSVVVHFVGSVARGMVVWPSRNAYLGIAVRLQGSSFVVDVTSNGPDTLSIVAIDSRTGREMLRADYGHLFAAVCHPVPNAVAWWSAMTCHCVAYVAIGENRPVCHIASVSGEEQDATLLRIPNARERTTSLGVLPTCSFLLSVEEGG